MNLTGATDLAVHAPQLRVEPLTRYQRQKAFDLAGKSFDVGAEWPDEWVGNSLLRLTVASILESRLLTVRGQRLTALALSRDPTTTTLEQLAAVNRWHPGAPGQAFELVVADGCNAGVPEVVEPISDALRLLGVRDSEHPQMLVLGLEKIASASEEMMEALLASIPSDARLRNGLPGRPAAASSVLGRLATARWSDMSDRDRGGLDERELLHTGYGALTKQRSSRDRRHEPSQLGRCDALVFTETSLVPASLKINRLHVNWQGWRDVPLWITTGAIYGAEKRGAQQFVQQRWPTAIATIAQSSQYMQATWRAMAIVDIVFARIDRAAPMAGVDLASLELVKQLVRRKKDTVAEVTRRLRASANPALREMFEPRISLPEQPYTIPTVAAPEVVASWRSQTDSGTLTLGHPHLFLGNGAVTLDGRRETKSVKERDEDLKRRYEQRANRERLANP